MGDLFENLRPPPPTPPDEICSCEGEKPVKLMCVLGPNPIHCLDCNLEVPPELIGLGAELTEKIAHWCGQYRSIDCLWLDSGHYENWARRELRDIGSSVNEEGLRVRAALDRIRVSFYWHFQDESADDFRAFTLCPRCQKPLDDYGGGSSVSACVATAASSESEVRRAGHRKVSRPESDWSLPAHSSSLCFPILAMARTPASSGECLAYR